MTTEQLDWIEREAQRNYDFRLQSFEALRKEAVTMLALIVALGGAALGFALDSASGGPAWLTASAFALAFYLACAAAALVLRGLWTADFFPPSNEPGALAGAFEDGAFTLEEVRAVELDNLRERIRSNRLRVDHLGATINRVWLALASAPIVWAAAAAVARVLV